MKNCDENLKLDNSFATNKKNVPMRKEDFFFYGRKRSNKFFSKISL